MWVWCWLKALTFSAVISTSSATHSIFPKPICVLENSCRNSSDVSGGHLRLDLDGQGSHRTISYTLVLNRVSRPGSAAEIAIVQPLPSTIFADIYELNGAADIGKRPRAYLFGKIDVESIETFAQPSLLSLLNLQGEEGRALRCAIPLHSRYPLPTLRNTSEGKCWIWGNEWYRSAQISVVLPTPIVLAKTRDGKEYELVQDMEVEEFALPRWDMPSGNVLHADFVSRVTTVVVLLSALLSMRWIWDRRRDCPMDER